MKLLTLALSAMLFALAAAPSANAWVRPEWVVVRWANADCKIWHNDTNAPALWPPLPLNPHWCSTDRAHACDGAVVVGFSGLQRAGAGVFSA